MLSSHTVRRARAAVDAFSGDLCGCHYHKSRTKSDLSAVHNECDTPENFPTIAACKAASLNKDSRLKPEAEPEASLTNTCLEPKPIGEPALVRIKAEKDPEKLFHLFKSNAHNRLVVENSFAFEDTVSRLA
ncbi:hypothetical protein BHE74_00008353 [Ensete ventricosum]|nr:hypothetical protein GW17_00004627 [Ensete ventricosum]RWW83167.1 hypothetical protein BHE74_00008353 [Ensete ventricosum]RZS17999.1 hypothetical protein BHM03_00050212 [Ensete ventricosum]